MAGEREISHIRRPTLLQEQKGKKKSACSEMTEGKIAEEGEKFGGENAPV